jgi:cytochrome c-type biogenesis protein CcmF
MVIHPPTLFLGFATTLVPFAFCMAGLWKRRYEDWVKPTLPWALFSAGVLGLGIIMGAVWAYETLNFGGYWNWDPVENAVYVPWLVLVAAIHTLLIFKNNRTALKTSMVLVISMFVLILYSTFLTRSGILGDASVHSFTDLGLSGQLLIYLLFFALGATVLAAIRWKEVPTSDKEASAYSREFWIFIGATTLCLMSFQVLVPTSIPVYNTIVELLGGVSNVAPPADQIGFYTKFQLWFAVAVALLSGTGQFFFWKKMDAARLREALTLPFIITLLVSSGAILVGRVTDPVYIILLTASLYSVVANATILVQLARRKVKLVGGSVAHIGVALMFVGILFSSGYSNVVSLNYSGKLIFSDDVPKQENAENLVLWINEPRQMLNYQLTYQGRKMEVDGVPGFVDRKLMRPTDNEYIATARQDIIVNGRKYLSKGDTAAVRPENTYHEIVYRDNATGEEFSLYPRTQNNPSMGVLASPDILHKVSRDIYTFVNAMSNEPDEKEWSELKEVEVEMGKPFFVNDYVATLQGVERVSELDDVDLRDDDLAVQAVVSVEAENQAFTLKPVYLIRDRMVGRVADTQSELGVRLSLMTISPETNSFTFGIETTQKDYIVLKAIEKPLINILWIGTLVMLLGFGISGYRRYQDLKSRGEDVKRPKVTGRKPSSRRQIPV